MPSRAPKLCAFTGCSKQTNGSYCEDHKRPAVSNWKKNELLKGDRHQRGYGTKWDKLRKKILRRDHYLCQPCYKLNKLTPAEQVDHIVPKAQGGTGERDNLQSICTECHNKKTATEKKGSY